MGAHDKDLGALELAEVADGGVGFEETATGSCRANFANCGVIDIGFRRRAQEPRHPADAARVRVAAGVPGCPPFSVQIEIQVGENHRRRRLAIELQQVQHQVAAAGDAAQRRFSTR